MTHTNDLLTVTLTASHDDCDHGEWYDIPTEYTVHQRDVNALLCELIERMYEDNVGLIYWPTWKAKPTADQVLADVAASPTADWHSLIDGERPREFTCHIHIAPMTVWQPAH